MTATALLGRPGPVLVAMAGIGLLSIMDAVVKHVAGGIPTWEIVLLRYAFGTAFALPLFLAGGLRLPPLEALRAHLLRSVVDRADRRHLLLRALGRCRWR